MNIATDTHGIVYLVDVPDSVGVRSRGQCSMSLRNVYTQTRNVQTQTQSTVLLLYVRVHAPRVRVPGIRGAPNETDDVSVPAMAT